MKQSLIVFAGPPLSGKTTLATRVSLDLQCPYLEMNAARLAILPDSKQSAADRDIAYRAVLYTAGKLLGAGSQRVILTATDGPAVHREGIRDVVRRYSAALFVVTCLVAPDEAVMRFRQRPRGHAALDLTEDKARKLAVVDDRLTRLVAHGLLT